MKISKQIMNPMRRKLLNLIAEISQETNVMYLYNMSGYKLSNVNTAIERLNQLGLIRYTGGGYFVISDKGKEYLEQDSN